MAALESSNKLSSLLPRRSPHWMPMLEDIATSHEFSGKMESMITVLMQEDEWHYISMDATLKLCMKLMGQASYRSPRHVRDEAPFGDDIAWRRLLTVRGRTGAVLMMHPLQNESSEQLTDAMTQHFSVEQLRAVVHTGADSPAEKLFKQLKAICPSMQSLILDPINLAIVCEYGFWNRKSSGSKQLRRIFKKCISVDADLGRDYWGAFYDGTNARPLGEEEMKYRDMISSSSMTLAESDSILDGLEMEVPFTDRLEFIQSLAALCRRYPAEVNQKNCWGQQADQQDSLVCLCTRSAGVVDEQFAREACHSAVVSMVSAERNLEQRGVACRNQFLVAKHQCDASFDSGNEADVFQIHQVVVALSLRPISVQYPLSM